MKDILGDMKLYHGFIINLICCDNDLGIVVMEKNVYFQRCMLKNRDILFQLMFPRKWPETSADELMSYWE